MLRGRRFLLVMNHKALKRIREKPYIANTRINKWIEGIQEFDFVVRYNKGPDLVVPDALSRHHEGKEAEKAKSKEIGERVKRGKWSKHIERINGKEYWIFDDGRTAEVPEGWYYWPGIKETIRNVVKGCETFQINNRKKMGGCEFVATSRPLEKVGVDVTEVKDEERYILVIVDYFIRKLWARPLRNKTSSGILKMVERWLDQYMKVEELISDNGREFCNSDFLEMCIRRTYYAGIWCTPLVAWKDEFGEVATQNSSVSKYGERFRKGYREQFSVGDKVQIALGGRSKEAKGRFTGLGEVVERFERGSYLVRKEVGRFAKKRHHDLEAITEP
ncbi:UNVERIFIED_CONTAM: hypothetical protein PYX00_011659 [Menopon gallinae]|uniref:Integrase catalytic domain-containing protein n=1 Tax=Menopon gallinae TaxID=328185 RepID=A0AAW2H8D4_9NEOP